MRRAPPAAALAAAALAATLGLAGCGGGSSAPPASGAARVVPADALAYVDISLDTDRSAVQQASSTARDLPGYRRLLSDLEARLVTITGTRFAGGIRPWLGDEAALAFVPTGASASELIVLGVKNRSAARRFVSQTRAPAARLLDGDVVIGEPAAVAAATRAAATTTRSLAGASAFRRLMAGQPTDRVIDAYATGTGLNELLGGRAGLAGVLAAVSAGHAGVAASLAPTADGLGLRVKLTGGSTSSFRPTLTARLPASTTWVADMASLPGSAPGLLDVLAAGSSTSPAAGLVPRLGQALRAQGVALEPLLALFRRQSAIFGLDGGLGLITRASNPASARLELGRAGSAMVALFAPTAASGVEPIVTTRSVAGVQVTQWQQGSAQIDDAVFDHDVVLTTSEAALRAILDQKDPLSGSASYRSVLPGPETSAGPVLFGAINRLVHRGDRTGLLESLGLGGATPSLAQISAAGLASTGGLSDTTAELFFSIS